MKLDAIAPALLKNWDKSHLWHPFTHMRQYLDSEPLIIARGEGVRLMDVDGRWYYDGTSSIWLNVHGHHVAALDLALRTQAELVAHATLLGQANVPAVVLAKRLVEMAPPGLRRVFFADNGAGAVEAAIKLAVQFWANQGQSGKRYVLGFTNNYHGDTLGAVGVAPDELFHAPFLSLLPAHPRAPYPQVYRCATTADEACQNSLHAVECLLEQRAAEIAAVIVEPVQGAGGIIPAPAGFLRGLRERCDRHQTLLIIDEVATGFGRTGTAFACQAEGVTPDLLCLGKGLTGGYLPVAATMATERLFEAFLGEVDEGKTFFHGHSYAGNPLGCAVGVANLDLLAELLPELPERARRLGELLEPIAGFRFVGDLRRAGFMVGIELARDRSRQLPFHYRDQAGWLPVRAARERGLLVRPIGNVIVFMPPLASSPEELEDMVRILRQSLEATEPQLAALAERGDA